MSALYQAIQHVRELRKAIRKPTLSAEALSAVEYIHRIVDAHPIDAYAPTRVAWRAAAAASSAASGSSSSRHGGGHGGHGNRHYNGGGNGNGGGRHYNGGGGHQGGHGGNSGGNGRFHQRREAPVSIPLTNSTDTPAEEPFETVRHHGNGRRGNRNHHHSHNSHAHHQEFIPGPPVKYVSRFRKQTANAEDVIMTKIRGKLNKFSGSNYNEIKEFITHIIDSGQTDMIKCFMKLVFEKAAAEEMFCPLYARLLSELSARYPILLEDMNRLYTEYMTIFDEVADGVDETYLEMCDRNVEKKYRRGYSQFLAELIKNQVLDANVFLQIVMKIVQQVEAHYTNKESIKLVEELADCLLKIVRAIQSGGVSEEKEDVDDADDEEAAATASSSSDTPVAKLPAIRALMSSPEMRARFEEFTTRAPSKEGLSNKARFTFMDCHDAIKTFSSS